MVNEITGEICIVGAGIGGLATAALLSKKGYIVKVFEREEQIGGRAISLNGSNLTIEKYKHILSKFHLDIPFSSPSLETIFNKKLLNGYSLDLGFHLIGGGAISNIRNFFFNFDESLDMLDTNVGLIKKNGFDFPFLSTIDKIRISPWELRVLLSGEPTMKKLDTVPISNILGKHKDEKMRIILEIFSRAITTVNNLEKISTGETYRSLKNILIGSKPVGYPKHGLSSIYQTLARIIRQNGGEIHLKNQVTKIIIENNKAIGVEVGDREYSFQTIISDILVKNLFTIADERHFPIEYVRRIKALKGTGSLCAYYSFKKMESRLLGKSFFFIERNSGLDGGDAVGMIDFMASVPDSCLAPPSHYLVQSFVICTPDEARSKKKLECMKEILDKNLKNLISNYNDYLQWAIYIAAQHLDGVAKTIDNKKPEIKSPVDNLYLVGDCIKAPGIGINCAINSVSNRSLNPLQILKNLRFRIF